MVALQLRAPSVTVTEPVAADGLIEIEMVVASGHVVAEATTMRLLDAFVIVNVATALRSKT
jgi:hypothetical protein